MILPWRLSEKAFKRFNNDIATAISVSPNTHLVSPNANITQEARLRDAIASHFKYNWPSATFQREKFVELYNSGKLKVGNKDGQIWIGSRAKVDETTSPMTEVLDFNDKIAHEAVVVTAILEFHQVKLLCLLASMRVLAKPIQIPKLTHDINYLQENFDVRVDDNNDGTITILWKKKQWKL